jgi:hypothetical protein
MAPPDDPAASVRRVTEHNVSRELQRYAALVAALFGLAGTVVGGGITYLTNKSLQDQQVAQETARDRILTAGAAKLAISRYDQLLGDLKQMESGGYVFVPSQLPPEADAGDQAAIVVSVSETKLLALARADDDVRTIMRFLRAQSGDRVSSDLVGVLKQDTPDIERAIAILDPLGRL